MCASQQKTNTSLFSVPKLNLETVELLEKPVYVGLQSLIDREQTVL